LSAGGVRHPFVASIAGVLFVLARAYNVMASRKQGSILQNPFSAKKQIRQIFQPRVLNKFTPKNIRN
jgi:hypothetical protein